MTWLTKAILTTVIRLIPQHLSVGTLMDGSGLKDNLETICGETTVVHMMNGKAVQRAFRGHLVSECLTQQIIARIIEDEPGFENHMLELEKIYGAVENGAMDLDTLSNTSCIAMMAKALNSPPPKKKKKINKNKNK